MERKEFLKLGLAAAAGSMLSGCTRGPETSSAASSGTTQVTVKIFDLKLRYVWGLSRGTWTTRRNAFVRLEKDGVVGIGEAAPIARYNETAESAAAFIEKARPVLDRDLRDYAVRFGRDRCRRTRRARGQGRPGHGHPGLVSARRSASPSGGCSGSAGTRS